MLDNKKTITSVFGYAGDVQQVIDFMPFYKHHELPIIFLSPSNAKIENLGPYTYRFAGEKAYIGQSSWDRQHLYFKILLEYEFDWYLLNDSDSLVLEPQLPNYLFEDKSIVYGNVVESLIRPNCRHFDSATFLLTGISRYIIIPENYHDGPPFIAIQPPYFLSRYALEKIVEISANLVACPITPHIDWWFPFVCGLAGLTYKTFPNGRSWETITPLGRSEMIRHVSENGATFLHSIKTLDVCNILAESYKTYKQK